MVKFRGKRRRRFRRKRGRVVKRVRFAVPKRLSLTKFKGLWPRMMVVRLTQYAYGQPDPGLLSLPGVFVVNVSRAYDPLNTSVRSRGFDEMATLYNHYVVLAAKTTARWTSVDAKLLTCGIANRAGGTPATTLDNYVENGYSRWKNLTANFVVPAKISLTMLVKKFAGKNPLVEDDFRGDTGGVLSTGVPKEQVYQHVFLAANDPTANPSSAALELSMYTELIVAFIEPRPLGVVMV